MFRLTALIALLGSSAALKVDSPEGQTLLAKSRGLEENNMNWMAAYSMVFQSCHTISSFNEEADENGKMVSYQNLVKYKMCSSESCKYGCSGGEYVADMATFVQSYYDWKMYDEEKACEAQANTCDCENYYGDEDVCNYNCYKNAGMDYCIEAQAGDDDKYVFELEDWLECKESEAVDQYTGQNLFVGPSCSDSGEQINLGVFKDDACTEKYSSEIFATYYGGTRLGYQDTNIVAENCISCKDIQEDNGYYQGYEISELCQEVYPVSAKCEENLGSAVSYPVTGACEYIHNIELYEKGYKPPKGGSTFVAVVFGLCTVILAGVAAHLFKLNSRKIELQNDAAIV